MCLQIVMCAPDSQLLQAVTYAVVIYGDAVVWVISAPVQNPYTRKQSQ